MNKFIFLFILIFHNFTNPFLSTQGNQIINAKGNKVRIKGVSWFGFETNTFCPHGLWTRNYKSMMNQIKSLGFNAIRLPYCNQMFDAQSKVNSIDFSKNPSLLGLRPIQVMDKIVQYARQIGLYIILDHHRSSAGGGPNQNGLWYTAQYPQSRFINDWKMLINRYKNNHKVIGADLHNEPHGPATWGDGNIGTDWKRAAQQLGNILLSINSKILIIVEGIENYQGHFYWWGGNLMGVRNAPIRLNRQHQLVYSPHDYPNSVFAQPWFYVDNFPNNLPGKFTQMWGFIYKRNIAPIMLGEFGSKLEDPKDIQWMNKIVPYLNSNFNPPANKGMSWIWWSWNPNSSDTGGILMDDWRTPIQRKLDALAPIKR